MSLGMRLVCECGEAAMEVKSLIRHTKACKYLFKTMSQLERKGGGITLLPVCD